MKENFVSYELAIKLRNKGFDYIECFGTYSLKKEFELTNVKSQGTFYHLAPLYQQAQKWLREKHNIHVNTVISYNSEGYIYFVSITKFYNDTLKIKWVQDKELMDLEKLGLSANKIFNTYEQALEEGLYEALKLID